MTLEQAMRRYTYCRDLRWFEEVKEGRPVVTVGCSLKDAPSLWSAARDATDWALSQARADYEAAKTRRKAWLEERKAERDRNAEFAAEALQAEEELSAEVLLPDGRTRLQVLEHIRDLKARLVQDENDLSIMRAPKDADTIDRDIHQYFVTQKRRHIADTISRIAAEEALVKDVPDIFHSRAAAMTADRMAERDRQFLESLQRNAPDVSDEAARVTEAEVVATGRAWAHVRKATLLLSFDPAVTRAGHKAETVRAGVAFIWDDAKKGVMPAHRDWLADIVEQKPVVVCRNCSPKDPDWLSRYLRVRDAWLQAEETLPAIRRARSPL